MYGKLKLYVSFMRLEGQKCTFNPPFDVGGHSTNLPGYVTKLDFVACLNCNPLNYLGGVTLINTAFIVSLITQSNTSLFHTHSYKALDL